MDISKIKERFELLKKLYDTNVVLISKLAKELRVRETDLMFFIEENPKLFEKAYKYTYRREKCTYTMLGRTFVDTRLVADGAQGLGLKAVYLRPEDNINTEEGAQHKKEVYAKYIYIKEFNNYGRIEGYYIDVDKPSDDKRKFHIWRNTQEKIEELVKLGVLSKGVFYYGGWGDCSKVEKDYVISERGLKTLKENGWSFNELKPVHK